MALVAVWLEEKDPKAGRLALGCSSIQAGNGDLRVGLRTEGKTWAKLSRWDNGWSSGTE